MGVKVGDKVRSLVTEFDVREGGIYEVADVFSDSINVYDDVGDDYRLMPREYKPVAVADSNGNVEHGNHFKVGDRVRCIDDTGTKLVAEGQVYTIEGIKDEFITVRGKNMFSHRFELVDAPLTIRAGKFYRTRDGRKAGPAVKNHIDDNTYPWNVPHDYGFHGYTADGKSCLTDTHDIIAEWQDERAMTNAEIFDKLEDWMTNNPLPEATPTTGFTVPMEAPELGGAELDDDDIVEMSIGELTGAIADALRVVGKKADKPNALKRGDLVVLNRPALVTGVDKYSVSVQTDGGNYSLPLTALRAA